MVKDICRLPKTRDSRHPWQPKRTGKETYGSWRPTEVIMSADLYTLRLDTRPLCGGRVSDIIKQGDGGFHMDQN